MGRLELNRRRRGQLVWFAAGFVLVQGFLAVGVERFWPAVRDPEFCDNITRLRYRYAEAPHRPLVVALGSSRTQMGLDAASLSQTPESNADIAPLVFNFGLPGGGPMMEAVCLERLLKEGLRPDRIFLEIVPAGLNERVDRPVEEQQLDPARLCSTEAKWLLSAYYERPDIACARFLAARLLPGYRYQAELRTPLGVDVYRNPDPHDERTHCDDYGWRAYSEEQSPEQRAAKVAFALDQYRPKLANFRLSPGADHALRDLLERCRREQIPASLVLMPEGSQYRALYARDSLVAINTYVQALAAAYDVSLIDARLWVPDDGFWDSHHLNSKGAAVFTARFGREALQPLLHGQRPATPTDAPSHAKPPAVVAGPQRNPGPNSEARPAGRPE